MQRPDDVNSFHDAVFWEIDERRRRLEVRLIEQWVVFAASVGLTIDDLVGMLDSGMAMPEITKAVSARPSR